MEDFEKKQKMIAMATMEQNIQKSVPLLKLLPEKMGKMELEFYYLKDRITNDYVTSHQCFETIRIHQGDTEKRIKEQNDKRMIELQ